MLLQLVELMKGGMFTSFGSNGLSNAIAYAFMSYRNIFFSILIW